jgi:hypothetical protein
LSGNIRNFVFVLASAAFLSGCSEVPSRAFFTDYLFGSAPNMQTEQTYPNRQCYAVAMQRAHDAGYSYPDTADAVFDVAYRECDTGPKER